MEKRPVLILMVILNSMVLLGQLWPQGAPPFAHVVNILTLILNVILFLSMYFKRK